MPPDNATDLSKSIEQLTGLDWGDPDQAETRMARDVLIACRRPLMDLDHGEIWLCVSQRVGFPFILDLVWPMLRENPLTAFEHYEGDVLASLLRADLADWNSRPMYLEGLPDLKQRALAAPSFLNDMFIEVIEGRGH